MRYKAFFRVKIGRFSVFVNLCKKTDPKTDPKTDTNSFCFIVNLLCSCVL